MARKPTPRAVRKVLDELEVPEVYREVEKVKHLGGRPSIYSAEIVGMICDRLSEGELLVDIIEEKAMPSMASVYRWREAHPEFREAYARAREMQAHACAERAVKAGRAATAEDAAAARVKFDSDRWLAGKLLSGVYGDRTTIAGDPDNPLIVQQQSEARANLIRSLDTLATPEPLTIEGKVET